jgi:hypothetical protein
MNIFTRSDAADQLHLLRTIAGAELHNLVFRLTTESFRQSPAGETSRRPLLANEIAAQRPSGHRHPRFGAAGFGPRPA